MSYGYSSMNPFTSNQLAVSQPYSYGMLKYSDYNIHGPIAMDIYMKLLV